VNAYNDDAYADSYSELEFPGCYYLAYRDLPEIISKYSKEGKAIDFGCGTGRSSRFLRNLGFDVTGIDTSESMIQKAKELDPAGKYLAIADGDFSQFSKGNFDLILSIFTFDNIPVEKKRIELFKSLGELLKDDGVLVCLDSTPELYANEWISFSTKDFPENKIAKSGGIVKVINLDLEDKRPCEDIFWKDEDYRNQFSKAGLQLINSYKPLADGNEPIDCINETQIAPWIIYVVKRRSTALGRILENYFCHQFYSRF
jgi:SAM-dependent methyltransferase